MSLEEEIAIYQLGQGVRSVIDLLNEFSQLDERPKRSLFVDLYCRFWHFELSDSDIEQVLADCSINATDPTYNYLNLHRLSAGLKRVVCIPHTANPPDGSLDKAYQVLLHLFKTAYQRRFALERDSANWRYRDLSSSEIVDGILARHWALVGEIYTIPGFRSEFVSLAKLWNNRRLVNQARQQEPSPEQQTHFDFLTYDEVVTESINRLNDKYSTPIELLLHSVQKALSKRYQVESGEAFRLVLAVLERHVRETYNTGLF